MRLLFLDDGRKLRPKYRRRVNAMVGACIAVSLAINYLFGTGLAHLMHLPRKPLINTEYEDAGTIWLVLNLGFGVADIVVWYLMGFVLWAAVLRWFYHWPVSALRELFLESKHPRHWLKDEFAAEAAQDPWHSRPKIY